MKLEFYRQIFEKYSSITFHENSLIGNRVVPYGWKDGKTDMSQLTVACINFVNALKSDVSLVEKYF
jgi:hypothetical protein